MKIFLPGIISRKRDGERLGPEEIKHVIEEYTAGNIPDYQMSALLMAVFFKGFTGDELHAWTEAMLHSGEIMVHPRVINRKIDKHSTGGVGDKISICLAPAVAALGVPVPMISGRGLGHTGGTLDKLESIQGFNVNLSAKDSRKMLAELGIFLIGQTSNLAPADKKLYALRDVTGTVESIPLIASSIMSKKLAEGIDGLVLDVKVGEGAFMRDIDRARKLARTLIDVGQRAGKEVRALLTDMSQPIGRAVGNSLEIKEAIEVMQGTGPSDVIELTVELGAEMLLMGKITDDLNDARKKIKGVLSDGRALELFAKVIERQGGDPNVCTSLEKLPVAANNTMVKAKKSGYVSSVNPRMVAMAALEVAAGRQVKDDIVDPATGVEVLVKVGDNISTDDPLAILHYNNAGKDTALKRLDQAFEITNLQPVKPSLIIEKI